MNDNNSRLKRKKHRSSTGKRTNRKQPIWKKVLVVFFLVCLVGILAGGGLFFYYASQAPELNEEDLFTPAASEILDKNGDVVATVGTKQRDLVTYENIPPLVEDAVLATEDVRFYDHIGVDPIRLGGALIANLTEGFGAEGGSTLTQQVVKRSLLSPEKTLERKAKEAWLAIQLESEYSKEEIFEMYVNKIYYSDNIYGIQTASHYYFNKDLNELTLPQVALLAGIPQSPNNYNPYDYPDRAKERRNVVLSLMEQHGKITEQEMQEAQQAPITEGLVDRSAGERNTLASREGDEAFVDVVLNEIEEYGDYDLFEDGLRIHTTMDPNAQEYMETILNTEDVIQYPEDKNGDSFQAGITLLDTQTGAVQAIGGGRNYGESTHRGYNFATDTSRQPGSAIKPLLVYAPAIEQMQWSTAHILADEPIEFQNGHQPRNWDDQFKGPVSMREALWDSRNIPAIKAFNQTGHEYAATFIEKLGFTIDQPLEESAAIGGGKTNTNSYEMAGAYAALGNNGHFTEPYTVTKIERRDGTTIEPTAESNKAMEPYTAYMVTDMLKSVIEYPEGTGTEARIPGLAVAGKTGTTNYSEEERNQYNVTIDHAPDSWFAGYTTEYTVAIWTGYEHKKNPLEPEERVIAKQIFRNLMSHISDKSSTPDFEQPANVITVEVEKGTNPPKRASSFTPERQVTQELFIEGTEPDQTSERYVPDLQPPADLSADYNRSAQAITLSWNHFQEEGDERQVNFEITKAENGGDPETIATTEQEQLLVEEVEPGLLYTFTITAVSESDRSEPGVIRVDTERQQPDSSETDESNEEPPETNQEETDASPQEESGNGDNDTGEEENEENNNTNQETEPSTEEQESNAETEEEEQNSDPSANGENEEGEIEQEEQQEGGSEEENSNQDSTPSEPQEDTEENDSDQEAVPPAEENNNSPENEDAENNAGEESETEEENNNQDNSPSEPQEDTEENDSGQEAVPPAEENNNSPENEDAENNAGEESETEEEDNNQDSPPSEPPEDTDENDNSQETTPPAEEQEGGNEGDNSSDEQLNANESNTEQETGSPVEEDSDSEGDRENEAANTPDEQQNENNAENEGESEEGTEENEDSPSSETNENNDQDESAPPANEQGEGPPDNSGSNAENE